MKNILLPLAIIIVLASCQSKTDEQPMVVTPLYNNAVLADTAKVNTGDEEPGRFAESTPRSKPVNRNVRRAVHRTITPETTYQPPVETAPVVTAPVATSTGVTTEPSSAGVGSNPSTSTASTIPQPEQKKGWSKAAKGAVIGAGAGAIGGAILSKKKGLGAVIGGVIGAAGGYVIGKKMDKKDNRLVMNYSY